MSQCLNCFGQYTLSESSLCLPQTFWEFIIFSFDDYMEEFSKIVKSMRYHKLCN